MKIPKAIKIILGILVFFTLPTLLFLGYVYFKYHEELPQGIESPEADALAQKMLDALDYDTYKKTNYLEWTFRNSRHYQWEKDKQICTVYWKEYKVTLHLNAPEESIAYVHNFKASGPKKDHLIATAVDHFNNDSFWLVAPYKVFDSGVERRLVPLENGDQGLLVTYTSGGSTPGDSYLWILEPNGRPNRFKMWTSNVPIDGLEASWSDWITTESGAQLPSLHKIVIFGIQMRDIHGIIQ